MLIEPGSVFGRLTVLSSFSGKALCSCTCGREKTVHAYNLTSGNTRSCGCLRSEYLKRKWLSHSDQTSIPVGRVFGRLTVVKTDRQRTQCSCSCGNLTWVSKYDLLKGKTESCGCLSREVAAENMRRTSTIHGRWNTREWNIWSHIQKRCYDPNAVGYEKYGAIGITVCQEWRGRGGFQAFLDHIGPCPSIKHTVDRKDNSKGYEPGNVRWATPKEQARNRRNNVNITAFGKTQCLAAWSEELGISPALIQSRLARGWPVEKALVRKRSTSV